MAIETRKLGWGHGSLIEHDDGTVEYRQTGKLIPVFQVTVADITGFSIRKPTRADKKQLDASGLQKIFVVQGSGTTLAECAVNAGTPEKIEEWLRRHPDFLSEADADSEGNDAASGTASIADELTKLAELRDNGILTDDEFVEQKARLLA